MLLGVDYLMLGFGSVLPQEGQEDLRPFLSMYHEGQQRGSRGARVAAAMAAAAAGRVIFLL